ncbi:MAG: M23 family metallopeptidase [Actinomycetota bacterium]
MTYLRTIAAITLATIPFATAPITDAGDDARSNRAIVAPAAEIAPIEPLPELPDAEIIEGVRVIADTAQATDSINAAIRTFEDAGWPLTNLEVRVDGEDGCGGHAGVRKTENGHDVVEICTDAEFVLLHELGHVWSGLYLDEDRRNEWLELRGLDSWHEGDHSDRGTEHAADVIAFGLLDTWHTPTSITPNDRSSLIEHFEWLFGIEPLHMNRASVRAKAGPQTANTETGTVRVVRTSFSPDTEGSVETILNDATPVAGYRFPMACGFPRWHSRNGGYGYEDARDWTHRGVDLYAYEGTPVVSPVTGLVLAADRGTSAGWSVRVEDATGRVHVLMHLQGAPLVFEGERVRSGQIVGAVGRTGNASGGGPHIHYEIRDGEDTIDPMPWLRATGSTFVAPAALDFHTGTAPSFSACDTRA